MTKWRRILLEVSREHLVSVDDIIGPRRLPHLVAARRDAIDRLRRAEYSLRNVARVLRRNYSTITHHSYPNIRAKKKARAALAWQRQRSAA